jgi:CRP-like cAMP-binding protein
VAPDELGDRWYEVAEGTLEVTIDGHRVRRLHAGEAVGERALLHEERRSASVNALTDAELLALNRADFLAAVAGLEPAEPTPPHTTIEALGRQPLLSGSAPASLAALAAAASALNIAAGDSIVSKGQDDDRWFVVLDGELVVQLDGRPPRRLLPGDSFGEIAVLHQRPRTATVIANTHARLMQIPGQVLRGALTAAS